LDPLHDFCIYSLLVSHTLNFVFANKQKTGAAHPVATASSAVPRFVSKPSDLAGAHEKWEHDFFLVQVLTSASSSDEDK
jgi:hypothetical protein